MSLVRLLGYTTLACGCVVGRYREVASSRELAYVEEKGGSCGSHGHRRNHTVAADRLATVSSIAVPCGKICRNVSLSFEGKNFCQKKNECIRQGGAKTMSHLARKGDRGKATHPPLQKNLLFT